ncbi:hypothetical protein V6N13_125819 [Hibiscus sabdariffa]|uniref:Uncharacterized protein n=1 Tax=Hibiscus sabdariffa TaxID=183260 RepID=A0ABR2U7I5_9ROSI
MFSEVNGSFPDSVLQVSSPCGFCHTALVTYGGQLFTFGDGSFDSLGHRDYISSTIPREVQTLSELRTTKVAFGAWHTAAVVKTQVSRLSVDSSYQAERRNFKHELKLESQTLLFPVQNGNFHLRGFYSPKMSVCAVGDYKNILPASISSSSRTSRGTSPISGNLSSYRSFGVTRHILKHKGQ